MIRSEVEMFKALRTLIEELNAAEIVNDRPKEPDAMVLLPDLRAAIRRATDAHHLVLLDDLLRREAP